VDNKELLVFNQLLRIVIKQVNPLSLSLMGGGGLFPINGIENSEENKKKNKIQTR